MNAQEGKTKAMRQWRFSSLQEIQDKANMIKAYVKETVENHDAGKEILPESRKDLVIPPELEEILQRPGLIEAFEELTLGKRRDYAEYIETAKKAETKAARLEKIAPMILAGIGLNDKYKK